MRPLELILALSLVVTPAAAFDYLPPGDLIPGSGDGRVDETVYAPDMRFPVENAPAFANSQVYNPGGSAGPPGHECDPSNYSYPWRDNYCEARDWDMPLCPAGQGHQGQDIRPATCDKDTHWAVAATDGTITFVGDYAVYLTAADGTRYDYLHMSAMQVTAGQEAIRGARLGLVSNEFGGEPTTIHLHFNIKQNVQGVGVVYVPPYMSLVQSYKRLIDRPAEGYLDLYEVVLQGTNGTDLHATSRASEYGEFIVHEALSERRLPLHPTIQPDWQFGVADYNGDGSLDFYAIKTRGECGQTEVFVYDGADQFRANDDALGFCTGAPPSSYLDQGGQVQSTTQWLLGDYNGDGFPDLWDIQTLGQSGQTEVHVWSGADGFQGALAHIATVEGPLSTRNERSEATSSAQVSLVDYNGDGTLDVAWAQLQGASGTTELHVLDGATDFQTYLAHHRTLQGAGGQGIWKWIARDYNGDGRVDLVGIATSGPRRGMTEVHVLDGATDYMTVIAHIKTAHGANGLAASNFYLPAP
jgi:murein DD-endopeptidase MepM/ murein hydrolase activator NlpD